MTINQSQSTNSEESSEFDPIEALHNYAWEFTRENISEYRDASKLLQEMAGIYPGDPQGTLQFEAFIMECMAEAIEAYEWIDAVNKFHHEMPVVEVTYG